MNTNENHDHYGGPSGERASVPKHLVVFVGSIGGLFRVNELLLSFGYREGGEQANEGQVGQKVTPENW